MDKIPFRPNVPPLIAGIISLLAAGLGIYSMLHGISFFEMFVLIAPPIIVIGMKLAAPRIPILQVAACVLVVFLLNEMFGFLFLNVSALYFILGELIIPFVCISCFGSYWVHKRYLPGWANKW